MSLPAAEATHTAAAIEVADRNSRNASLTLAFALPGDTLLFLLYMTRSASAWPKRGCSRNDLPPGWADGAS